MDLLKALTFWLKYDWLLLQTSTRGHELYATIINKWLEYRIRPETASILVADRSHPFFVPLLSLVIFLYFIISFVLSIPYIAT
jgi:hypothetical protein